MSMWLHYDVTYDLWSNYDYELICIGVLAFDKEQHGNDRFVFQGVHEQINFGPSDHPFQPDDVRQSKMVFIGKNLDYEFIKTSLLNCTLDKTKSKITMHKRA